MNLNEFEIFLKENKDEICQKLQTKVDVWKGSAEKHSVSNRAIYTCDSKFFSVAFRFVF